MIQLIMGIDALCAKLAMLALVIVSAKFVSKRIKIKVLDRFLMNVHRPAGYVLVGTGVIHMVLSFSQVSTTAVLAYVVGFISLVAIIAAILAFYKKNKVGGRWIVWHRIFTVIAMITVVLHPMLR
ncbi:hypothetical protein [Acetobacterium wieringae]|uniref:hypothetical protein n=1 Tax=Acetobacterium wieringae TaxID=52694 RepID=UPI003158ABDE